MIREELVEGNESWRGMLSSSGTVEELEELG